MNANTVTVVRFALRTVTAADTAPMYVHALQQYTMPSATEDVTKAKSWASARGAAAAAKRAGLTNVAPVEVLCAVDRPKAVLGLAVEMSAAEQAADEDEVDADAVAMRDLPAPVRGTVLTHEDAVVVEVEDYRVMQAAIRMAISAGVLADDDLARLRGMSEVAVEFTDARLSHAV